MVWVNLLPWRERWVQRQRRKWLLSLTAVPLLVMVVVLVMQMLARNNQLAVVQLDLWQENVMQLQQVIAERGRWQRELNAEQDKLANRQQHYQRALRWGRLVDSVAEAMPATLWLVRLQSEGNQLSLQGFCQQVSDAWQFQRWLQEVARFNAVTFSRISLGQDGLLAFKLNAEWPDEASNE